MISLKKSNQFQVVSFVLKKGLMVKIAGTYPS